MAVFTPVSEANARKLLQSHNLGDFVSLQGISAGIENTNYFLTTTQGEYVLTLFEVLTNEQLPFYVELMHYLAEHGIPVPHPQTRRNGKRLGTLLGKPCTIVTRLQGGHEPDPGLRHCELAASTLAQAHLAARDFSIYQPNLRGLAWWQKTIPELLPFLDNEQIRLIQQALAEQSDFAASKMYSELPAGPAHCDLFRDNVLFDGTYDNPRMGGIIDFYFAGWDTWLFDVAVSVNDWCIQRNTGEFIPEKLHAWLEGYSAIRPFTDAEKAAWPVLLRAAALRFWVSRLYDFHLPRPAQTLKPHDPTHFERLLQCRFSVLPADCFLP